MMTALTPRAAGGVMHLLQRLINCEARRLLTRRKLFERLEERDYERRRCQDKVVMIQEPVVVSI